MSKKPKHLNWADVLSYDAPFNLVIGPRTLGKTFGLREQMLRDFFKNGESHVAIVRTKDSISTVACDYFGQIVAETKDENLKRKLEGFEFQTMGNSIQGRYSSDNKKKKNKWEEIVRVIPLSLAAQYKQVSMHGLRRVVFDEAIIDKQLNPYMRYLPNEFRIFQNLIGTIQRFSTKNDDGSARLRVYLLGNAVDLTNPYFENLHIYEQLEFGNRWFKNKVWLFCYPNPDDYDIPVMLAEQLAESASDYGNKFASNASDFIGKKPSNAKFAFGISYRNYLFGVWLDIRGGCYYVNRHVIKDGTVFALSTADNKPNYIVARTSNKTLQNVADMYCVGCLKFDTPATRDNFNNVLSLFGVKCC